MQFHIFYTKEFSMQKYIGWLIAGGVLFCIGLGLFFGKELLTKKNVKQPGIQNTFAMIKPDAVAAHNTGKIIDRIEHEGFTITGLKKVTLSAERAEQFYAEHKGKKFFPELINFMTSGPVVMMVLSKENAVNAWRELMGSTNPAQAAPETLRKLFGTSMGNNAVHGSDAAESAAREIELMFPELEE